MLKGEGGQMLSKICDLIKRIWNEKKYQKCEVLCPKTETN